MQKNNMDFYLKSVPPNFGLYIKWNPNINLTLFFKTYQTFRYTLIHRVKNKQWNKDDFDRARREIFPSGNETY